MTKKLDCVEKSVTVVVPVRDEAGNIGPLLMELDAMAGDWLRNKPLEIIVVNDGSEDDTRDEVLNSSVNLHSSKLRLINLKQSLGQAHALQTGFSMSSTDFTVAIDGDGQNNPADIPALIEKLAESGADCVSGRRSHRIHEGFVRRRASWTANFLLRLASGLPLNDFGCTLKAYKTASLRAITVYGGLHRIIPALLAAEGGTVVEIEVDHRQRAYGQSKYSMGRLFPVFQDLLVAFFFRRFRYRPMHAIGGLGTGSALVALVLVAIAVALKFAGYRDFVETPLLLISSIFAIGGLNIIGVGLLAEVLLRDRLAANKTPFSLALEPDKSHHLDQEPRS